MNNSATLQTPETAEFASKRVLVTGGTKGIGGRRQAAGLRGEVVLTTARSVPIGGRSDYFIQADVSTPAGADCVIEATLGQLGGLDILINSVGGTSARAGRACPDGRPLAADARFEPPVSRPPRSRLLAVDAQAGSRRHRSRVVDPADTAAFEATLAYAATKAASATTARDCRRKWPPAGSA